MYTFPSPPFLRAIVRRVPIRPRSFTASDRPRLAVLNWRDSAHPEGGGSERYVHRVAEALAARGWRVTFVCADHGRAPRDETVGGVTFRRRGGRHTVYLRALAYVATARPDVVLDVQNAVPFASTLVTRGPVVVLVHHVHREQWPILFGRWLGRLGWFLESRIAPRVYRRCPYVTVSRASADELAGLGVEPSRVAIVPNGVDPPPPVAARRSVTPRLVVVGRLVPHKQVEHAIDTLAGLAAHMPDVVLDVVGHGLVGRRAARPCGARGVADRVRFPRLRRRAGQARADRPGVAASVPVGQGGLGDRRHRGGGARGADRRLPLGGWPARVRPGRGHRRAGRRSRRLRPAGRAAARRRREARAMGDAAAWHDAARYTWPVEHRRLRRAARAGAHDRPGRRVSACRSPAPGRRGLADSRPDQRCCRWPARHPGRARRRPPPPTTNVRSLGA